MRRPSSQASRDGFAATALRMSAGIVVWALHFTAVYGGTSLACARGVPGAAPLIVMLATVVAVAVLVPIVRAGWRRRDAFEPAFTASIAASALLAVVWEGLPALWVPACAGR